jgi:hypothetical protein
MDGRGDDSATMIVPPQPARRAQKRPRRKVRIPWVPILLVLLAALLVAGGAYLLLHGDGNTPLTPEAAASEPIRLQAVGAFDPIGGDGEHDDVAGRATDQNRETFWDSEHYDNFTKEGVGLVLMAPRSTTLSKLTVNSVGTNFDAQIKAGGSPTGPFTAVSGGFQPVGESKSFAIDTNGKKYRYYMVWLKLPFEGGQAKISEVTART